MNSPRILLVEDSAIQGELLRRLLVEQGYDCQVAKDGKAGLIALQAEPATRARLVISDVTMPVMGGYQMCTLIKQDPTLKSIPVILLTELSNSVDVVRGLNAGADAYLTKPYDRDRLLRQVRQLLAHSGIAGDTGEAEAIDIDVSGQSYAVTASRRQILHMLVSTYDNAVEQNRVLRKLEQELRVFNKKLESRVQERTAALETEQARAKEAELRYRTLFALLPEGVVLMSPDSCSFIESNDVACAQLGYSQQAFAKLDLFAITAADAHDALRDHLKLAYLHDGYSFTSRHLMQDGRERDVEIRIRIIELGGQRLLHCIFRDITELNQAHLMAQELRHQAERIEELNREIAAMETLGRRPLEAGMMEPEAMSALVGSLAARYINLLDLAVERQAYQVKPDIAGSLRAIAEELGSAGAGPREVVSLHGQALRVKVEGLKPELKWAFMEEGRLMVLELMGYLVAHYRKVLQ